MAGHDGKRRDIGMRLDGYDSRGPEVESIYLLTAPWLSTTAVIHVLSTAYSHVWSCLSAFPYIHVYILNPLSHSMLYSSCANQTDQFSREHKNRKVIEANVPQSNRVTQNPPYADTVVAALIIGASTPSNDPP